MGFIDYHGEKEDRYDDVLQYVKDQQEEEARRLEDEKIRKWLIAKLGTSKFFDLELGDLMKHIIVRYRSLSSKKNEILSLNKGELKLDAEITWNDFCIAFLTKRLEAFNLDCDKQYIYYQTFVSKVFRLENATPAETYYKCIKDNISYQEYFNSCYDLVQEKQFWKWLGCVGSKNIELLDGFIADYQQLSVLIGFYLFQGIRPQNDLWKKRLDIECEALDRLKADYRRGRFRAPNYNKLRNPLYQQRNGNNTDSPSVNKPEQEKEDVANVKKRQFNKNLFQDILASQQLQKYVEACKLLRRCELPEEMDVLYGKLITRMPVLQESLDKFQDVYQPDMYQFYDYYIPEALQLTATYIEYLDVGISTSILEETEKEVLDAANKLLLAIDGKIDEIYKFASMQIKAKAKALESLMSQDGYVNSEFKIK